MRRDRQDKIPQLRARQRAYEKAAETANRKGDQRSWDHNKREARKLRDQIVDIVKNAPDDDEDEPTLWRRR